MTPPILDPRCLDCGYVLKGLPENRCPECGRVFDPENPQTFVAKLRCGVPCLFGVIAAISGLVVTTAMLAYVLRQLPKPDKASIAVAIGVWMAILFGGVIAGSWSVGRSWKALCQPPATTCHRWCHVAAFVFGLPFWIAWKLPVELTVVAVIALACLVSRYL
jgi:hypothetical protein